MRPNNSLVLYKRHTSRCKVHEMSIAPKEKNFWFACDCPFAMTGKTPSGDIFPRQTLGVMTLTEAEAYRAAIIRKAGAQDLDTSAKGIAITEAINRYLASREDTLNDQTAEAVRSVLGKLAGYAAARGVQHMSGLTADLIECFKEDEFKSLKGTTRSLKTSKVRSFLREAFRRDWTGQALAEKVRPYRAVYEQKEPYTQKHLRLLLAEAENLQRAPSGGTGYCTQPHTFRVLLELMSRTGLRVRDAVMFDPACIHQGEQAWVYTFIQRKTKKAEIPKTMEVYLDNQMKGMIDGCIWLSGRFPFAYPVRGKYPEAYLCQQAYYTMQQVGSKCGVPDCRPHRLRDTFAVNMLLRGVSLGDVSRLLGHASIKTTETYYARWTPGRNAQLQGIVAKTFL